MKNTYLRFENNNYEIVKIDDKYIVKDKKNKVYYEKMLLPCKIPFLSIKSKITNKQLIIFIIVFVLLILLNFIYFFLDNQKKEYGEKEFIVFFSLYSFLQVVSHEYAHYITFSLFGRKIDKFGVKFNYIFPSFYIRMNDIYMLSNQEKIIVHSAGLFINYFINFTVLIISSLIENSVLIHDISALFLLALFINTLPILNSDGYKIALVFLKYNEKKIYKGNNIVIKLAVVINIILCIWYIFSLWKGY